MCLYKAPRTVDTAAGTEWHSLGTNVMSFPWNNAPEMLCSCTLYVVCNPLAFFAFLLHQGYPQWNSKTVRNCVLQGCNSQRSLMYFCCTVFKACFPGMQYALHGCQNDLEMFNNF